MDLIVRAGGLQFFGSGNFSSFGLFIDPDGFEGYDDGVATRSRAVSRENAHGDYVVPGYLDARVVSISGWALTATAREMADLKRQFNALLAVDYGLVSFNHLGDEPRWGTATRAPGVAPKFKVNGRTSTEASFQIQLKFPDPRFYGDTHTLAATAGNPVVSINRGNFAATSIITVSGVASGYTITGPGGLTRSIVSPIAVGNPHVVDMATGYVRNNSGFLEGVSSGSTWAVPAGGTASQTISSTSGSVSMSVETKATFI